MGRASTSLQKSCGQLLPQRLVYLVTRADPREGQIERKGSEVGPEGQLGCVAPRPWTHCGGNVRKLGRVLAVVHCG